MQRFSLFRRLGALVSTVGLIVACGSLAHAHSSYLSTWQSVYPSSSSDDIVISGTGSSCQLCHFTTGGGGNWNAYGWKMHLNIQAGQTVLNAIQNCGPLNSDLDPTSATNAVEIAQSAQPGWTPGPNNTEYLPSSNIPGLNPPVNIGGALDPASPMTHYCSPGLSGTIACPCANPPSGAGLGCNNSDNTGGAGIGAVGSASLATDTIVISTYGQKLTSTTVLLQGTAQNTTGLVFGQGVRCVAGTLKRLYVRAASAGGVSLPAAGDASISARSAALGDVLSAGAQREYMAYYRDPTVSGGCAATSTFNATSSGRLTWGP